VADFTRWPLSVLSLSCTHGRRRMERRGMRSAMADKSESVRARVYMARGLPDAAFSLSVIYACVRVR